MLEFIKLKNHIGTKIGNKGVVAAIVAKKYADKVTGVEDKVEKYKKACDIFDKDSQGNIDRFVAQAESSATESRKNRKSRKSKSVASEEE